MIRIALELTAVICGIFLYVWLVVRFTEHMVQTLEETTQEEENPAPEKTPAAPKH